MNDTEDIDPAELAGLFAEVVGEADSDGGLVSVRVDPKGRVAHISLDPGPRAWTSRG